MHDIVSGILLY